jgi:peptidoglycan/xylan/chitin deacetylase (PgdA/CDA1 family)
MKAAGLQLLAGALHRSGSSSLVSRAPSWSGVLTLNYHRVGDPKHAHGLPEIFSATAEDFDRHLAFLKQNADVISGDDLASVLKRKSGRHVLITFDDGYRDNYELVYPLLKKHRLPATFFICTGLTDRNRRAWWDDIAWMINKSVRAPYVADRPAAIARAIAQYRSLPEPDALGFLDELSGETGVDLRTMSSDDNQWMTWEMIRELRANGMTIGAHTVSHPILSKLTPQSQLSEIQGSRDRIAAELNEAPRLFAYPVGKPYTFNQDTRAALETAGFEFAFSFYGGHQPVPLASPYDVRRCSISWGMTPSAFEAKVALPKLFARW